MENSSGSPVIARVWRGRHVESEHRGAWCVVGPSGVIDCGGDQARPQFLRSAGKPFQALAALRRIEAHGFSLSDAEVAILSASHAGQPRHIAVLEALLARAGIPVDALQCGAHAPYDAASARDLVRRGLSPGVLHHSCSGKHTGMLLAAKLSGEPLESYLDAEHPVQQRNRSCLAEFAGCSLEDIGVEVDGCSAPTFTLRLPHAARAFATLVDGSIPDRMLATLRRAVAKEPVVYCGEGKTCTQIAEVFGEAVYPKAGAEGFYGAGVADEKIGIAIKVEDGSSRAMEPWIATLLLRHARSMTPAARQAMVDMTKVDIHNARGRLVGRLEIVG